MQTPNSTRRQFCVSAGLASTAAWLAPHALCAQDSEDGGIVGMIRKEAAVSPIIVQHLRGKISVLMGSGGNIGVLPGPEGKLLVDAGITASRPRIIEALQGLNSDGGIDGMIQATEANLARATGKTIIIPGHGPVGNRADLMEYREMLVRIREKVAALKRQKKSLAEVVAANPTAAYDARWGGFATKPDAFTALVYAGV